MGIFSKLFGKSKTAADAGGKAGLTQEQFLATEQVLNLAKQYGKPTVVLHPQTSGMALSPLISKFGGLPNLNGFDQYPCCDACDTPLNFVFQLYQREFPEHYFPTGKNLFQLFRCPNNNCPGAYADGFHSDLKMFVHYFNDDGVKLSEIVLPAPNPSKMEIPVPDCYLKPQRIIDYPIFEDYGDELNDIETIFGEKMSELFLDTYGTIQRTKIGGWPSFTQPSHYPECQCGKVKEFFFQLSSEDTEEGIKNPDHDQWSPHHIMIGDVGNIYFYLCRDCGESSIESYWDCY